MSEEYRTDDPAWRVHQSVKAFYLALPGRTEAGWAEVRMNPRKFNKVWRLSLGLEVTGDPPPAALHGGEAITDVPCKKL